jgi:hypothetical protein
MDENTATAVNRGAGSDGFYRVDLRPQPQAAALKVAHPLMLRAIAAEKKRNDRIEAKKICDCLHCDFLPECYMASTTIRERRRTLRCRNLLVRRMVHMKNKIGMLVMETGASYNKHELHKAAYFREPCWRRTPIDGGALAENRESALMRSVERDSLQADRAERLMSDHIRLNSLRESA